MSRIETESPADECTSPLARSLDELDAVCEATDEEATAPLSREVELEARSIFPGVPLS